MLVRLVAVIRLAEPFLESSDQDIEYRVVYMAF